jgi:hypothetical protein
MNSRWSADSSTKETTADSSSVSAASVASRRSSIRIDETGPLGAGVLEDLVMTGEVLLEHPEPRCDLGEGDLQWLHEPSIARHGRQPTHRPAAAPVGRRSAAPECPAGEPSEREGGSRPSAGQRAVHDPRANAASERPGSFTWDAFRTRTGHDVHHGDDPAQGGVALP